MSLFALTLVLLAANPVLAYGGPGSGVEFIGYFMSLLAFLGVCFAAVFLWPFYALMRWIRGPKQSGLPEASPPEIAPTQNPTPPAEPTRIEQ